jgi:hypothetical protein
MIKGFATTLVGVMVLASCQSGGPLRVQAAPDACRPYQTALEVLREGRRKADCRPSTPEDEKALAAYLATLREGERVGQPFATKAANRRGRSFHIATDPGDDPAPTSPDELWYNELIQFPQPPGGPPPPSAPYPQPMQWVSNGNVGALATQGIAWTVSPDTSRAAVRSQMTLTAGLLAPVGIYSPIQINVFSDNLVGGIWNPGTTWSPDSQKLAFTHVDGDVWATTQMGDPAPSDNLTNALPGAKTNPQWTQDGRILFMDTDGTKIYAVPAPGSADFGDPPTLLIDANAPGVGGGVSGALHKIGTFALSHDGTTLAWSWLETIQTAPLAWLTGSNPSHLPNAHHVTNIHWGTTPYPSQCLTWSPNDNWLAYDGGVNATGTADVRVVPATGGATILVDSEGFFFANPITNHQIAWSADGHRLAYTSAVGSQRQMRVLDFTTTGSVAVPFYPSGPNFPISLEEQFFPTWVVPGP